MLIAENAYYIKSNFLRNNPRDKSVSFLYILRQLFQSIIVRSAESFFIKFSNFWDFFLPIIFKNCYLFCDYQNLSQIIRDRSSYVCSRNLLVKSCNSSWRINGGILRWCINSIDKFCCIFIWFTIYNNYIEITNQNYFFVVTRMFSRSGLI